METGPYSQQHNTDNRRCVTEVVASTSHLFPNEAAVLHHAATPHQGFCPSLLISCYSWIHVPGLNSLIFSPPIKNCGCRLSVNSLVAAPLPPPCGSALSLSSTLIDIDRCSPDNVNLHPNRISQFLTAADFDFVVLWWCFTVTQRRGLQRKAVTRLQFLSETWWLIASARNILFHYHIRENTMCRH